MAVRVTMHGEAPERAPARGADGGPDPQGRPTSPGPGVHHQTAAGPPRQRHRVAASGACAVVSCSTSQWTFGSGGTLCIELPPPGCLGSPSGKARPREVRKG